MTRQFHDKGRLLAHKGEHYRNEHGQIRNRSSVKCICSAEFRFGSLS